MLRAGTGRSGRPRGARLRDPPLGCRARDRRLADHTRGVPRAGLDPPGHVVTVPNGNQRRGGRPRGGKRIRDKLGLGHDDLVVASVARSAPGRAASSPSRRSRRCAGGFRGCARSCSATAPTPPRARPGGALNGSVAALGYRDDVMAVLDAADAVLHTPRTDALPTGLIEAAAAGVPVVATATGGIRRSSRAEPPACSFRRGRAGRDRGGAGPGAGRRDAATRPHAPGQGSFRGRVHRRSVGGPPAHRL